MPPVAAVQPAGAWLPPSASLTEAPRPGGHGSSVAPGGDRSAAARRKAGDAPLLADLPFDAPDDLPTWLVTIGSAIALPAFLLPWSAFVIGSSSSGGYTDQWGLATPTHLLVFAACAATLGLAVVPNRLPIWIRSGLVGLVLVGLLVGLAWPYLFAIPGASIGVLAIALSGILLAVGGGLAVRARHAGPGSGV
jgi:hypothetical protein